MQDPKLQDFYTRVRDRLKDEGFRPDLAEIAATHADLQRGVEAKGVTGRAMVVALREISEAECYHCGGMMRRVRVVGKVEVGAGLVDIEVEHWLCDACGDARLDGVDVDAMERTLAAAGRAIIVQPRRGLVRAMKAGRDNREVAAGLLGGGWAGIPLRHLFNTRYNFAYPE